MNKVKLVIEIDEKLYETAKSLPGYMCGAYQLIIRNGTPLPEDFSLEDYERYKKDSESLSWINCPDRMGN